MIRFRTFIWLSLALLSCTGCRLYTPRLWNHCILQWKI